MRGFRTALVTGASSGIGAALALELARRGVEVSLAARRADLLEQLVERIRGEGGRAEHFVLDVRDTEAVRELVLARDSAVGGLDLVVANAGVGRARHASRLEWDDVRATLEVNVMGAIATLTAGLECMRERGHGTLCGVSSLAGIGGMPTSGAYSASKAALSAFLETLAIDLRASGLRVVDVQPGFVVSEMTADAPHPLPFLWPTERAARRIADDLEAGRPICSFPWQLSTALGLLRRSPRWGWRATMARLAPRRRGR
jgi:short-subunit dehydrogenase